MNTGSPGSLTPSSSGPVSAQSDQHHGLVTKVNPLADHLNAELLTESEASSLVEQWAMEINKAAGYSAGWAIQTGALLQRAQAELPHGLWSRLFDGGMLKFGLRTAEMLIKVSRHPILRHAKYSSSLPPAWSVLHELSKLPSDAVEQAIIRGVIGPELSLAQARAMVRDVQAQGQAAADQPLMTKSFDLPTHRARLEAYLRRQAERWPVSHRAEFASLLEAVAVELRGQKT
jgi:hypothetical protein